MNRRQTILVSGATSGIGEVTARRLAERGYEVVLLCRDSGRARALAEAITRAGNRASMIELDLADLDSVRRCAEQVLANHPRLDVLINNAGLAGAKGVTRQGFEIAFGVNHLGHYLLTTLLLPRLLEHAGCRVVNVSSYAHYKCRGLNFDALREPTRSRTGMNEYRASKLANVLHAKELGRRFGARGLHAYAVHPGVVQSRIWRAVPEPFQSLIQLFMIDSEKGAATTLHVSTSSEVADHNGCYYERKRVVTPSRLARDAALAERLWIQSAQWCRVPADP